MTLGMLSDVGTMPDREALDRLLVQIGRGDTQAFEALYRAARGAVYGLTLSYLHHSEDAQDATQDTFVRIWDSAPGYRPQGTPMAWVLAIAKNTALMKLRQRGREEGMDDGEWDAIPSGSSCTAAEDRALLQEALAQISDRERRVVLLHASAGLRHREIAQLLDMPLSTVLSHYRRALKKMNDWLKGEEKR